MSEESGKAKIIELNPAKQEDGMRRIENPLAPEMFADNAASFSLIGGVVRITLESFRPAEVGEKNAKVVIGRLAMPVMAAQSLVLGLDDFLKKRGSDPKLLVAEQRAPADRAVN